MKYFGFLPPLGIIPVQGNNPGFSLQAFFNGMTYRQPVIIEGAKFEAAMRESLSYPPVDTQSGEFFWLYFIRENMESVRSGNAKPY